MAELLSWFGALWPEYHGNRPEDFYTTYIGAICAGFFALFIAGLILHARRRTKTDTALASVFFVWAVICFYSVYRILSRMILIPYVTPGLWIFATVSEFCAVFFILRELRAEMSSEERDHADADNS